MCNACVRLATVDPIQLCHVQPNPIQPTVLWHSVKPSSAEPGIFPVFFVCVGACVLVYTKRKEKKRKERKGKKIGIPFNVYVCNACVGLATVDPIQLSHVQPNHIQPNVLWHSVKSRSAEPGIFPVFFVCVGACVLVYTKPDLRGGRLLQHPRDASCN